MKSKNLKIVLFSAIFSAFASWAGAQTENPILPGFYPTQVFAGSELIIIW